MRNGTVDYTRLLAAFGIVAFHSSAPGAAIGYAGLPFFIILLAPFGFEQSRLRASGLTSYSKARAVRMLMPWLGWSILYGLAKLAEVFIFGKHFTDEFAPWMLLTGPALHLWFLPFAFCCGFALWLLWPSYQRAQTSDGDRHISLFFAAVSLSLPILLPGNNFSPPLQQYLFALPAFFLGLAFAFETHSRWHWALMAAMSLGLLAFGLPGCGLQLIIAGWIVLLCFALPTQGTHASQFAAKLSLTVYLAHPLVLAITARALHLPSKGLTLFLIGLANTMMLCVMLHLGLQRLPAGSLWRRLLGV